MSSILTESVVEEAALPGSRMQAGRGGIEAVAAVEYRTPLIADVVTGKADVRAAAAILPDETDEREARDDGGVQTDEGGVELVEDKAHAQG